jgi:hypothetical protein
MVRPLLMFAGLVAWLPCQDQPPKAEAPEPFGCWQREGEGKVLVRMEPHRISFFRDGRLDLYRAVYTKDAAHMSMGGVRGDFEFTIEDHVLKVGSGKDVERYRKLATVPDELVVTPLVGGKEPPTAEQVRAIQRELAERQKDDQAVRKAEAREKDMAEVDRRNTEWLCGVVGKHGWIDATRFGGKTAGSAFLLVQHSGNLALMSFALPQIEADVRAHRVDAQDYALLCDRLRLWLGDKQLYGSQLGRLITGEQVVLATEDPANVDVRRRELGLMPLGEYLKFFREKNGGKLPGFEPDL